MVSPNREGLKQVSNIAVDSNFVQTLGMSIFKYQGEETEEYKQVKNQFLSSVEDCIEALHKCKDLVLN